MASLALDYFVRVSSKEEARVQYFCFPESSSSLFTLSRIFEDFYNPKSCSFD